MKETRYKVGDKIKVNDDSEYGSNTVLTVRHGNDTDSASQVWLSVIGTTRDGTEDYHSCIRTRDIAVFITETETETETIKPLYEIKK